MESLLFINYRSFRPTSMLMPTKEYIIPKGSKNNKQCLMYWASQVMLMVKNLLANAGDRRDAGSIPRLGIAPGWGHVNTLLENSMNRGAWWIHRIKKSHTQLKWLSKHAPTYIPCIGLTKKFIWVFLQYLMGKKTQMNFLANSIFTHLWLEYAVFWQWSSYSLWGHKKSETT